MNADFQKAVGYMIVNDRQWLERCCVDPGEYMGPEHIEFIKNSLAEDVKNRGAEMIYTILLENGTVGTIHSSAINGQDAAAFIGEVVNVHLHDENGNPIEQEGRLVEVLDVAYDWV